MYRYLRCMPDSRVASNGGMTDGDKRGGERVLPEVAGALSFN
jgi:hypothetical protein